MDRSEDTPGEIPDEGPSANENEDSQLRYLFTVDGDNPDEILRLVCDLVAEAGAELVIASPVTIPEQTPLEMPGPKTEGRRKAAKFGLKAIQECSSRPSITEVVRVGHRRDHIVRDLVETYGISTLITEDYSPSGIRSLVGFEGVDAAAVRNECDTIIVTRIEHLESIESILVPIAGGPHSGLAIDTGLALARQNDATLELLHVYDPADENGQAAGKHLLETGMERVGDYETAERTLREASEVSEAIIDYTDPFDVTVFGAPREGRLRQFIFGTVPEAVSQEAKGTILTAHRGGANESWLDRWI